MGFHEEALGYPTQMEKKERSGGEYRRHFLFISSILILLRILDSFLFFSFFSFFRFPHESLV